MTVAKIEVQSLKPAFNEKKKSSQEIAMRKSLIIVLGLAALVAFAGVQPALADCRSENAACVKGSSSPFDSVACGSLYRTCAAHHAIAAQQQAKQTQSANTPAVQNAARPSGGNHSGRPH